MSPQKVQVPGRSCSMGWGRPHSPLLFWGACHPLGTGLRHLEMERVPGAAKGDPGPRSGKAAHRGIFQGARMGVRAGEEATFFVFKLLIWK